MKSLYLSRNPFELHFFPFAGNSSDRCQVCNRKYPEDLEVKCGFFMEISKITRHGYGPKMFALDLDGNIWSGVVWLVISI